MWSNYNDYPSQIKSFQVRINHNGYPSPILRIKDDDTTLVITYSPRNKVVITHSTDSKSPVQQIQNHTFNIFKITGFVQKTIKKNKKKESLLSQNLKTRDLGKN